jgi:hypothetical protein
MTDPVGGERQHAPATARNREPIIAVLRSVLPPTGLVLEIASGTGEHAVSFAAAFPNLEFQPSDPSPAARGSIAAWTAAAGAGNVRPPLDLDAAQAAWPIDAAAAVLCINMIHISPWEATVGLMRGTGRILSPGAPLYLYGPFIRAGRALEPSNAAFNASLRRQDARWGIRELEDVTRCAADNGLTRELVREMPANNLSLVFRKAS